MAMVKSTNNTNAKSNKKPSVFCDGMWNKVEQIDMNTAVSISLFRLIRQCCMLPIVLLAACTQSPRIEHPALAKLPVPLLDKIEEFTKPKDLSQLSPEKITQFNQCMAPLSIKVKSGIERLFQHFQHTEALVETEGVHAAPFFSEGIKEWTGPHLGALDSMMLFKGGTLSDVIAQIDQSRSASRTLLVEDYLKAYFGTGESLLLALDASNPSNWRTEIAKALRLKPDSPTVQKLQDELSTQLADNPMGLAKFHLPMLKDDSGFVSRDGTRYTFPGITSKGSSASIDHSQVSADLIRIVMEAIRDAYAPLPVVPNATVIKSIKPRKLDDVEIFDPASQVWHVDANAFLKIEGDANNAESVVAGAVGKAIRGGSWGSLNNEALAKTVETAAGVFARHIAERGGWCLSSVKGNTPGP